MFDRRHVLLGALAAGLAPAACAGRAQDAGYVCPPCGCSMDDVVFSAPGRCPACDMVLKPMEEADLGHAPDTLPVGAGRFTLDLPGKAGVKRITVHYVRPAAFTAHSPVVLVLPGAGRNSGPYRNAWLAAAERAGLLVAALGYPEADFDFAQYTLGGLARSVRFENAHVERVGRAEVISMDTRDVEVIPEPDRRGWVFSGFDSVFDHLRRASGSSQARYAAFGHSAGGQILHRMALTGGGRKAGALIAANAGWYTLPDLSRPFPEGLAGLGLGEADLARAFARPLTVLLGEADDHPGAGGTFLRTPATNAQGEGRLQRGRFFFEAAQAEALRLSTEFNWRVETVPGVGHDHAGMTEAAPRLLPG